MPKIWKNLATVGTLALALVVLGCEQTTELTQQSQQLEVGPTSESVIGVGLGQIAGLTSVRGGIGSSVRDLVRATVGPQGGVLELDGHVLTVPQGSVRGPTTFTMRQVPNGGVEVELQATRSTPNDVGSRGFNRPVRIALSYAGTDADDPGNLVIVRVDDGTPQETHVSNDGTATVWAAVNGFSRYRLCSN